MRYFRYIGGAEQWHIKADVLQVLKIKWDMIIAFPPCTYLSNAGANKLYSPPKVLNYERYQKGLKAKEFFMKLLNADCPKIAVENPIHSKIFEMPAHSQEIQPYEFGHPYTKRTRLWLKGLPPLMATRIVKPLMAWAGSSKDYKGNKYTVKHRSPKMRSKTFPGIAKAMAEQWGGKI